MQAGFFLTRCGDNVIIQVDSKADYAGFRM